METAVICDVCKDKTEGGFYGFWDKREKRFRQGHRKCLSPYTGSYAPDRRLWEDGAKGSYGVAWRRDVEHRKVVHGGEVIRDYGKRYFS